MPSTSFVLTADQRTDRETRVRSGRGRADAARRARAVLLLADGCRDATIATRTGHSSRTIALWMQRFAKHSLAVLVARHRGSKATVLTPARDARVMTRTRRPTVQLTGPHHRSAATCECSRQLSRAPGTTPVCNRIGSNGTCGGLIPSARRKQRM